MIIQIALFALTLMTTGCLHFFGSNLSADEISEDLRTNGEIKATYIERTNLFFEKFYLPAFKGNVLEKATETKLTFADQTVNLGAFIGWQGLALYSEDKNQTVGRALAAVKHIVDDLVVLTTLPDGTTSKGYFIRDNVDFSSIEIDGKSYKVKSDALNGRDNEMSQDQLIHVLFGYFLVIRALEDTGFRSDEADQLKQMITSHADAIGKRLKAYGYQIYNPNGELVKRGHDARAFAWPIAKTISAITGHSLANYLNGLDLEGRVNVSTTELRELYQATIDALLTGACNIKVGEKDKEICHRFTLHLINILYVTSEFYDQRPLYIVRMDDDGDYLTGSLARLFGNKDRLPEVYYEALEKAVGIDFSTLTGPALWCYTSRWIYMPSQCPKDTDEAKFHNALDFLRFYLVLKNAQTLLNSAQ